MSSPPPPLLPPLPSSSSSPSQGNDGGGGGGGDEYEGPSRSRPRGVVNEVWPEPFLEALAIHVATDAALFAGRLAAAQALANVFQVCSTWQAISRSELLWQRLTHRIWHRRHLIRRTWRQEYMYRHRTARNFRTRRSIHFNLHFDPADVDDPNALSCRCLAISDHHLAAGFADGAVRIFSLRNRLHARTFRPQYRDRLGPFSGAVSGIILAGSTRLVFATLDGDIHVANLNSNNGGQVPRRARVGDVLNDGALVDFAGSGQWWVGLYAGVPGRAFHIWNGLTEELTFVGGSLTDAQAVTGWRTLTEATELVGRVRVSRGGESAVACTSSRVMVLDLRNQGVILGEEEYGSGVLVGCMEVWREAYLSVDGRGVGSVRRVETMEAMCGFGVNVGRVAAGAVMGCMNGGCALICAGGAIRVWGTERMDGEYLYRFGERVQGEVKAMVADERHLAVAAADGAGIHLWDFGAEEDEDQFD